MTASLINKNNVEAGFTPVDYSFTSGMDIALAMYDNQVANYNLSSESNLVNEEYNSGWKQFRELSGIDASSILDVTIPIRQQYAEKIDPIIEQYRLEGKDGWADIPTSYEAQDRAIKKAQDAKLNYDEARMREHPDAWGGAGTFAGAMAGYLADPLQAGMTALTTLWTGGLGSFGAASRTGYVARAATVEAAVNSAIEIPTQTSVMDWQQKVGHDYGWEDALLNVAIAGVAGAGFSAIPNAALFKSGLMKDIPKSQLDFISSVEKQAIIDAHPRGGAADGGTLKAHHENMDTAAIALSEGKMPDPLSFNAKSTPRKFIEEDGITYDHAEIANEIISKELKDADIKKTLRSKFIDEIKAEYKIDSELAKGDPVALTESIRKRADELVVLRQDAVKLRQKVRDLDARIANEQTIASATKLEGELKANMKKQTALSKKLDADSKLLKTTEVSSVAEGRLKQLESGVIPKELEGRYGAFKKNVKQAVDEIKAKDAEYRGFADELLSGKTKVIAESLETVEEAVAASKSPELTSAANKEFDRVVAEALTGGESSNMKVSVSSIDGIEMELNPIELKEHMDSELSFLQKLKACALG